MGHVVRRLAVACLLLLGGCVNPGVVSRTPPPSSTSPALQTGIVDPQALIDQATHLGSIVLRVDKATAKRTTMSDFTKDAGASRPSGFPDQPIWVVAIRGDIRVDAIIDLPHAQCALFAYDAATGDVRASRSGPAAMCDAYFN